MNYIYDILLNFKEEIYDFFDWNNCDNISHVRKIPIFKISTEDLYNIKNNNVLFDNLFLETIKNKTEIFTSKNIRNIEYACILSDGITSLALQIQNKKIKKSTLLIDEEMELLEKIERIKKIDIKYKIIKKININYFKTRKEIEMEKYIKKEISKIEKDEEKLKYIYFDCFNEKENDKEKILLKLNKEINNSKVNEKLFKFFKLTNNV